MQCNSHHHHSGGIFWVKPKTIQQNWELKLQITNSLFYKNASTARYFIKMCPLPLYRQRLTAVPLPYRHDILGARIGRVGQDHLQGTQNSVS